MRKEFFQINCILVIILCILMLFSSANAELKLHFIDVGQGDSILIQCDDVFLLVDAGPENAGKIVHDYLSQKLNGLQLDYVIATHEHDDHLGGMPEALSGLTINQIYSGGAISMSYWFSSVLTRVSGNTFSVSKPAVGDSFMLGEAAVTFLDPTPNPVNANDGCLVFRIDYGENSALFMADLEGEGELYLLNNGANLKADVLKVGHHGGDTSTSEQFLKSVSPRIAVISVGTDNKHGHPHQEVINRLEKYGITIYRTDWYGTIVLTSDGKDWNVEVSKVR